ncbi:DUF58 domain-containing protein [Fulvivirga lutea]|uniref:DUF58 domain-containing protein n=1 Tax=Fulvivirga lutea TaxID=2810512 RepID=A0A975A0B2_9BACT|nr:DUF58 domain-containing protein [Fulvivirga lutea]QSE96626.1 DUF58 domain-containing protein [Fulvivirga lutea]
MNYQEFLTPENLNSVKGLEFVAKTILEGHTAGLNRSRKVGQGMEFSQYRSYEPGDDIRLLDWKMLARSSRYYIKQAEIDTNISVKFIIDASASMLHEDSGLTKMDYARFLCATLGYLTSHQGDAVGLFALNEVELKTLYPRAHIRHFNRFLHYLVEIENKGKWPANSADIRELHDRNHKELIVFISDLYEENDELLKFIKSLKTNRNEVVVIHLMGENELNFNYTGSVTLEDLETYSRVKISAADAKEIYEQNVSEFLFNVNEALLREGIDYNLFTTGTSIGEMLSSFLKRRNALI